MRISKIMLITLIMGILAVPLVNCSSETDTKTATENQVVVVQRGYLVIDITASGNLALSLKEDLTSEISGTTQEPLTVEEILVEEGDSVTEGQVIAVLDTTYLEQALKTAERAVSTAEIDLESATDSY
ncbi:biotin/lipoyl-binding protein, partial [Chloroflexota bacterium]